LTVESFPVAMTARPHRRDIRFIRRFMLLFGMVSSVFDYLTFALLLVVMRAPEPLFRTGWFVESVVSATLVVLVVRTRHPLHRSRPGRSLATAALAVVLATIALPYLPGAELVGFQHLPPLLYLMLGAIVLAYVLSAEVAKRWFYAGNLDAAGVVPLSAGTLASGALSHPRARSR